MKEHGTRAAGARGEAKGAAISKRTRRVEVRVGPRRTRDVHVIRDPAALKAEHGLVRVVDEWIVGTNVERSYARAADRFTLTEELASSASGARCSSSGGSKRSWRSSSNPTIRGGPNTAS